VALDRLKDLETVPFEAPLVVTEAIAKARGISEALSGRGESETLQRVTVNIGTIEGGTSPNLVPTHAIARADIRLPVGMTTEILVARLDEWLAPLEGVSWRAIRRFEPSFTPPDHELICRTASVAAEVLGSPAAVNMRVGGSDSRWYRKYGVPTVVLGLTPFNMGGADEYVLVDELVAVAKIHTLVAFDFLSAR
jgi:acetylornithine deacetylase/succinyl-diaminopimelate desuccinylase-like protein